MSTKELKMNLMRTISSIEDVSVLEKIKQFLKNQTAEKVYILSEDQLAILNESIEQFTNGQFLTEEEAEKDIEKWFKEEEK